LQIEQREEKKMKKVLSILALCMMLMSLLVPAFASSDVRTGNASNGGTVGGGVSASTGQSNGSGSVDGSMSDVVNQVTNELIDTSVTTDDIVGRLESKGNDVVRVLQTVGKYVCIGAFMVCCVITLVGIVGNKRLLVGGIIGLVISGVAYAGIVCGREIVNWIASWAIS